MPGNTTPVTNEYVYQASTKDGTSFSWYCDDDGANETSGAATLQVDASAITGGVYVVVADGVGDNYKGFDQAWSSGTLNLSGQLITGTYDVFVTVVDANYNILAVKILCDQTIPGTLNGGNSLVFGTSDETTTQMLTVNNLPSGFSASDTFISYSTADFGDALNLNFPFSTKPDNTLPFLREQFKAVITTGLIRERPAEGTSMWAFKWIQQMSRRQLLCPRRGPMQARPQRPCLPSTLLMRGFPGWRMFGIPRASHGAREPYLPINSN